MPFLDHLEELRWRLLRSMLAVLVGSALGWWLVTHFDVLSVLMAPILPLLPSGRLMYTSPTEPFFITLKLAFAAGILLASPIITFQVWGFLAPALYERERRVILPSLVVGLLLFCAGGAAAYFLVLPRALVMLASFQQADLAPIITADKYFGFAVPLILAFGAITELPLVMVILAGFGLVTPAFLSRNRRYALVLAAAVAAFLAPPDALSMLMMMVPLMALYEVSIWCVWVVTRRRARRAAAEAAAGRVTAALLGALLLGAATLRGQQPPVVPRPDTTRRLGQGVPGGPLKGAPLDTATARRLGLPTGPSRTLPASDAVIDSLMQLKGFRRTRYMSDTLRVTGDSGNVSLLSDAYVEQEGTKLEADSIRYRQGSCRLDAQGSPHLFDQNSVMVGADMSYDTCIKRGTISEALTDFQQGGATWYMRGHLAVDSGSTRMYGARSTITSDDQPVPDYHFATGEVK
ncbi:MAG TPA: twin-arginine translocase subunit TatC, partial [Gemmatimonadales bacterium]|nr:twin-arginine translocase subunit TatC [Gemmatimonadales bacterium]